MTTKQIKNLCKKKKRLVLRIKGVQTHIDCLEVVNRLYKSSGFLLESYLLEKQIDNEYRMIDNMTEDYKYLNKKLITILN